MSTDNPNQEATAQYKAGRAAFERGHYRKAVQCLEYAAGMVEPRSSLGGDVQLWLAMAYEAADYRTEAIALCEQLSRHPHDETRRQASRLLYILKAPQLKTSPEWLSKIPDLGNLEESNRQIKGAYEATANPRSPRSRPAEPEPIDLSQVNTKDNGFVWVGLGGIGLLVGWFVWAGIMG